MGYPITIQEKIFDLMLSGSIQFYNGSIEILISDSCYIRIFNDTPFKRIIDLVENISHKEKKVFRENIYNFLISEKVDQYRYKI